LIFNDILKTLLARVLPRALYSNPTKAGFKYQRDLIRSVKKPAMDYLYWPAL